MKKEEKKTKKKRNALLLSWMKVVVKENWSKVRNRMRDYERMC